MQQSANPPELVPVPPTIIAPFVPQSDPFRPTFTHNPVVLNQDQLYYISVAILYACSDRQMARRAFDGIQFILTAP